MGLWVALFVQLEEKTDTKVKPPNGPTNWYCTCGTRQETVGHCSRCLEGKCPVHALEQLAYQTSLVATIGSAIYDCQTCIEEYGSSQDFCQRCYDEEDPEHLTKHEFSRITICRTVDGPDDLAAQLKSFVRYEQCPLGRFSHLPLSK